MHGHSHHQTLVIHKTSVFSYWPIALLYTLAIVLAYIAKIFYPQAMFMSQLMGFIIALFGLIKLNDVAGFAKSFAKYDPLAARSSLYAKVYPFIEIILGGIFILQVLMVPATIVTLLIYTSTLYGAWRSLYSKEKLHCACVGTYFKLPLSQVSITESLIMIAMSVYMLVCL